MNIQQNFSTLNSAEYIISSSVNSADQAISNRVRMHRLCLGLNQADLAQKLNVSVQQVQKYEKGTNRTSSGKLQAIAELFNVPISQFFDEQAGNLLHAENYISLSEKDTLQLIGFFKDLPNPSLKKAILELVKQLRECCATST